MVIVANKEAEPVMISFEKLGFLLSKKGKKWQYLRDCGISPGIVAKMKDGSGHTDTRTIQKVCEILHCQPGQIMEYNPVEKETYQEDAEKAENVAEIMAIAERLRNGEEPKEDPEKEQARNVSKVLANTQYYQ